MTEASEEKAEPLRQASEKSRESRVFWLDCTSGCGFVMRDHHDENFI